MSSVVSYRSIWSVFIAIYVGKHHVPIHVAVRIWEMILGSVVNDSREFHYRP